MKSSAGSPLRASPLRTALLAGASLGALVAPGGGAAQAQSGPFLYVPNQSSSNVSVVDTSTNLVAGSVAPMGNSPQTAAVNGDESFVYVTNQFSNTVTPINTATNTPGPTITVGNNPVGAVVSPDGKTVYVTNSGSNSVTLINTATNTVVATIAAGNTPYGVAVSPDGKTVYVTNFTSNTVTPINTATNTAGTPIAVGSNPVGVVVSPDGKTVYVTNSSSGTVTGINTATNTVVATITVGTTPFGLAVTPDGKTVYVVNNNSNTVTPIDTATNTAGAPIPAGTHPIGVTVSPDGKTVYVANFGSNTITPIDIATNIAGTSISVGSGPRYPGICANGNALLASGLTFKANTSGALGCTGLSGPIFTGGTMQFAGASITSSLPITLMSQGGTFDTAGNNATLLGTIGGAGGLTKIGLGTLTLSGAGTYAGATLVSTGTLQAGAGNAFSPNSAYTVAAGAVLDLNSFNQTIGSLAGSGSVTLGAATLTTGNDGSSTAFSGTISGTGGLTKIGSGTLTFSGANTYMGGTTISVGTLTLSGAGTLGATSGTTAVSGGTLDIGATNQVQNGGVTLSGGSITGTSGTLSSSGTFAMQSGTVSAILTGTGAVSKTTNSTVTFSGANTYSGGTTISAGTLSIGNNSALGSGAVTFNGGTLRAGTAFLSVSNAILLGSGGGTLDAAGAAGPRAFSFSGNITDGTTPSGPLVLTSSTGVPAGIAFTGNNSYSAATIINASAAFGVQSATALSRNSDFTVNGELVLASFGGTVRSLSGSGLVSTVPTFGAQTLTIALPTGSATFGGVLQDGDAADALSLVKSGAGTQVLTGINTYTGTTTVNGGVLEVNGSIASTSSVTVNSGGTLSGIGTVDPAAATIMSGGTLAPGNAANPTGTLTITGNLAFQSGAIYLVQVTPIASASTNVSGTATLGGATVNALFAGGTYISKQYTILTAGGGVSSTFGSLINTNLPTNFSTSLSYDPTHAFLNLTLNFTPPPPPGPTPPNFGTGLSGNQQAVGNALINFFNSTGGIPLLYGLLNASGLTQASGESATGSQQTTFQAMSQFMGLLTDPFMGRGNPISGSSNATPYADESASSYAAKKRSDTFAMFTKAPPAPFVQRWSVWAAGYGGSQSTSGNAVVGSNDTTSRIAGTAVGADYLFSPNTLAGFALAGGGTSFGVNNLGSGRSDLFQAGAYVRHTDGAAYITGALAYGWQDITTNRTIALAGIDQLRAEFNANAYSGRVEGGYRFVVPFVGGVGITPYAAGQFTTFDLPAYAESVVSGTPNFALSYASKSVTDSRSELGIRTDKSFVVTDGVLTLRSRFAWAHDFDPNRAIAATFQALPGASFVVNGAAQASDSALTTASAEMKWINGWSAAATFEGEFSNVTRSYAGKGVVRKEW